MAEDKAAVIWRAVRRRVVVTRGDLLSSLEDWRNSG
jgi:hypothetical protein